MTSSPLAGTGTSAWAVPLAYGALAVAPARAVPRWLDAEPVPSGVGDPDGETSLAPLAGLSGGFAVLLGLSLLVRHLMTRAGRRGAEAGTGRSSPGA